MFEKQTKWWRRLLRVVFKAMPCWLWRAVAWSWRILFKRILLPILLVILTVDFVLEWQGIPRWLKERLFRSIDAEKNKISCSWIQAGLVHGIVVHDYAQQVLTPAGEMVLGAEKASLRLDRWELLMGRIVPRKVQIEDGYCMLLYDREKAGMTVSEIMLSGMMEENDVVAVRGTATSQGLDFEVDARWDNGREGIRKLLDNSLSEDVVVDEELCRTLGMVHLYWQKMLSKGNDSTLHLELDGRLDLPQYWRLNGYVNIRDAYLDKISMQQAACVFSGGLNRLEIQNMRMWLGRVDSINGSAVFFPGSGMLEANVDGVISRDTIIDFLGIAQAKDEERARLAQMLEQAMPWETLRFKGKVEKSELSFEKVSARLECTLPEADCWGLGGCRGQVAANVKNGVVSIEKAHLAWSKHEYVDVEGSWNVSTGQGKGRVHGARKLSTYLNLDSMEGLLTLSNRPCEFSAELTGTELTLEGLTVRGKFVQSNVGLFGVKCSDVTFPFSLDHGVLTLSKCAATRADSGQPLLALDVSCDLAKALESGTYGVSIASLALVGSDATSKEKNIVSCSGNVTWRQADRALSLKLGANVFVENFYQDVLRHYDLDSSGMLKHINCDDAQPMRLTLEVPELSMQRLNDWKVLGSIHFGAVEFNGLPFKEVSCESFEIRADSSMFRRISGVTEAGDNVCFDLRVDSNPMTLSFSNCDLEGDPRIIGAFLVDKEVSDVYLSIYKDFVWSKTERPHLQMPLLVFRNGESWSVTSDGIYLNSKKLKYRSLELDEANVIVMLNLPASVEVEPITVMRDKWWMSGSVSLDLLGTRQCRFELHDTVMGMEVLEVAHGLWPEYSNVCKNLTISSDCRLQFRGSMFLSGDARLKLTGSLGASAVAYQNYRLEDVAMDWSFDSGDVSWQMSKGMFHGGKVTSGGEYNIHKRIGRLLLLFSDISLNALLGQVSGKAMESAKALGRLSGELNLIVLQNWAGRKLHLDGTGHLHVSDCDLWKMPVLSKLEGILNSATLGCFATGLGRISEVDADLNFGGQRMTVSNAKTNGTIIALDGNGAFSWGKGDWRHCALNFMVNGTPVKNVKLLSLLLSPVSKLFQAELSGTLEHNSWKMKSLRDMLF